MVKCSKGRKCGNVCISKKSKCKRSKGRSGKKKTIKQKAAACSRVKSKTFDVKTKRCRVKKSVQKSRRKSKSRSRRRKSKSRSRKRKSKSRSRKRSSKKKTIKQKAAACSRSKSKTFDVKTKRCRKKKSLKRK